MQCYFDNINLFVPFLIGKKCFCHWILDCWWWHNMRPSVIKQKFRFFLYFFFTVYLDFFELFYTVSPITECRWMSNHTYVNECTTKNILLIKKFQNDLLLKIVGFLVKNHTYSLFTIKEIIICQFNVLNWLHWYKSTGNVALKF